MLSMTNKIKQTAVITIKSEGANLRSSARMQRRIDMEIARLSDTKEFSHIGCTSDPRGMDDASAVASGTPV